MFSFAQKTKYDTGKTLAHWKHKSYKKTRGFYPVYHKDAGVSRNNNTDNDFIIYDTERSRRYHVINDSFL